MKKFVGGLTLAAVVSLCLISMAVATDTKTPAKAGTETKEDEGLQPAIVIDELRHDMGEVYEQDKFKHVFKVRNTGEADLVIKNVKPG